MKIKSHISILLSISLMLGLCTFYAFALNDNELKITVAADTHYQSLSDLKTLSEEKENTANTKGMLGSDMYFYATTQGQMNFESTAIMKKLLDEFSQSDSQYLLIAGDLTCGKRQSHEELARLLEETEKASGKEIFVVCGNHDCSKESSDTAITIDEFKSIYADFGYNQALDVCGNTGSYTAELDENYRLIAIDSCIYGEDDGQITDETLAWLKAQASKAKSDGKQLIAMMHHSILPHFSLQPMIDDYCTFAEEFVNIGISLVYTGHIHANDISSASFGDNILYDVQTGSLISYPNAYREVQYTENKIDIKSRYITEIDTSLLAEGYTEEQLAMLENDFPGYAYGFFEAGVCRWINRYIGSAGKLGKLLKLDEGSKEYEILNNILLNAGNALALPIYDDNSTPDTIDSIEEIASLAGYTLPKTDYERIYQVAARVMVGFYHGDEDESINETEIPLLFDCIKAVLAKSSADIMYNNSVMTAVNGYGEKLTKINSKDLVFKSLLKLNYNDKYITKLTTAFITPLLEGFTCDLSEPSDIDIIIDGTYKPTNTIQVELFKRIVEFLKKLVTALLASF